MYSIVNLNAEIFILAPSFDQCINLFSQVISQINQAEMLIAVANLLMIVI